MVPPLGPAPLGPAPLGPIIGNDVPDKSRTGFFFFRADVNWFLGLCGFGCVCRRIAGDTYFCWGCGISGIKSARDVLFTENSLLVDAVSPFVDWDEFLFRCRRTVLYSSEWSESKREFFVRPLLRCELRQELLFVFPNELSMVSF